MTQSIYNDPSMVKSNFDRLEHDQYFTIDQTAIDGLWYFLKDDLAAISDYEYNVWEPACGKGHISKYLNRNGLNVKSSDLNDWGFGETGKDFLKEPFTYNAKHVVTNPPYIGTLTNQFVEQSLKYTSVTKGITAMLVRNEWDCAKNRRYLNDQNSFLWKKIVLQKRPKWIEKAAEEKNSGPRHNYCWMIWNSEISPTDATIHYYHPELERK